MSASAAPLPRSIPWSFRFALPLALASGIGLGLPVHFTALAPLQLPSLALLWWLLADRARNRESVSKPALAAGLGYAVTRIFGLMLNPLVLLVLVLGAALFWLAAGLVAARLARSGPITGALAMGGWLAFAEWCFQHAMPLFGSGQSFAVCWSPWGDWLPFVPLFGMPGLVFLLGLLSWGLSTLTFPGSRGFLKRLAPFGFTIAIASAVLGAGMAWRNSLAAPVAQKVAVWGCPIEEVYRGSVTRRLLLPAMAEASRQGAALIVFPETILQDGAPQQALGLIRAEAARLGLCVAVGWYDNGKKTANRLTIIGSGGEDLASYTKTNLVPLMEKLDVVGDGVPARASWAGIRLSSLICQDDNFPATGWAAAAQHANLLAVPTFDWPGVHHAHLLNSRWRPLENGLALARAAIGGHSALVDSSGRVLASADCTVKAALVVADVPLPSSPSPYHRWRDWPVLVLSLGALAAALLRARPAIFGSLSK